MANRSNRGRSAEASAAPAPGACEPEVRRWTHPIPQPCEMAPAESTLHYICCALSYQNELLSEIQTLLERLCADRCDGETQG